jgi:hypothetical protein
MANGLFVEGIGIIHWTFVAADSSDLNICSHCYYVPEAKVRLIKRSFGVIGEFVCTENNVLRSRIILCLTLITILQVTSPLRMVGTLYSMSLR